MLKDEQGFTPARLARFGITYLCGHTGLGVRAALKEYLPNELAVRDGAFMHPKSAADREGFEWGLSRFLEEAGTLARFEHRNVVRVRDCFEANNTAYIVMDYEEGESLGRLSQRLGTLTEAQLKRVLLLVAGGRCRRLRPSARNRWHEQHSACSRHGVAGEHQ